MSDHWNSLANLLGTPSITPAAKKSDATKAKSDSSLPEPTKPVEKAKEPSRLRSSWDAVTSFFGIQPSESDSLVPSVESEQADARPKPSERSVKDSSRVSSKREKTSFWDSKDSTTDAAPLESSQTGSDEPVVSFGAPRRKGGDRQPRTSESQPRGERQPRVSGERPPRDGERTPRGDGERPLRDERPQRGGGNREQRPDSSFREERAPRTSIERTSDSRIEDPDSMAVEPRSSQSRHRERGDTDRPIGEAAPERRSHRRPPRRGRAEGELAEPSRDIADSVELESSAEDTSASRSSGRDRVRSDRPDSRSGSSSRSRSDSRGQEERPTEGRRPRSPEDTRGSSDVRSNETRSESRSPRSGGRGDARDSATRDLAHSSGSQSGELRSEGRRSESSETPRGSRHRSADGNRNADRPARNERGRGPRAERVAGERLPAADGFGDGIDDNVGFVPVDDDDFGPTVRTPSDRVDEDDEIKHSSRRPRSDRARGDRPKRQMSEEDDRRGGDEDREAVSAVTKSGKIPSWAEALEGIVAANTENHQRNTGGGGRGRGRGPRQ